MELTFIAPLFSSLQYVETTVQALLFVLLVVAIVIFSAVKFYLENKNKKEIEENKEEIEENKKFIELLNKELKDAHEEIKKLKKEKEEHNE